MGAALPIALLCFHLCLRGNIKVWITRSCEDVSAELSDDLAEKDPKTRSDQVPA